MYILIKIHELMVNCWYLAQNIITRLNWFFENRYALTDLYERQEEK